MVKNFIWRVDGAIFNTTPAVTYAVSRAMNDLGHTIALNIIDGLARRSFAHCINALSERFNIHASEILEHFNAQITKIPAVNMPPHPGAAEFLQQVVLRGGTNFAYAVFDKPEPQKLLALHGLTAHIQHIAFPSQEEATAIKEVLSGIIAGYELDPSTTMLVSDREIDLKIAHVVGLRTALFQNQQDADWIDLQFNDYTQLREFL